MLDRQEPFFTIPNKIFKYGLNASELAVFFALKSHQGRNSVGVFPSMPRLAEMTSHGLTTVKKALATLKSCNMIQWERGLSGRANTYFFLGTGAWVHKQKACLNPPRKRTRTGIPAEGYAQLSHNDSQSDVNEGHTNGPQPSLPMSESHSIGREATDGYDLGAHIPQQRRENGDNSAFRVDKSQTDMTDSHSIGRHAAAHRSPRDLSMGRHATANHTHVNQTHKTIAEQAIFQSLLDKIKKRAEHAEFDDRSNANDSNF